MTLSDRKSKILAAVVERYLSFGEPVGSKAIMSDELNVSSATIRNELSALNDLGFITQPHTSAGRVPTKKGYRYYIDNLMEEAELPQRVTDNLTRAAHSAATTPERVLKHTASVLSEISHIAAVATTPSSENARVHRLRFVLTGRHTAMAVLMTSNGTVKNRLFRCDFVLTPQLVSVFDKALNEKFSGVLLKDINKAFIQTVASSMGELTLFIPDVLMAVYECAQGALETSVIVSGGTNLLFSDSYSYASVREVMRLLQDNGRLAELVNRNRDPNIFLSDESRIPELKDSCVITARYEIAGENAGALALVGPLRVDYKTLLAQVTFACGCVSNAIGELVSQNSLETIEE